MPEKSPFSFSPELTIAGRRVVRVQRWSRRSSVRAKLFLLFVLVTVLVLSSTSNELFLLWEASLILGLLFVLWPFIQGTYLLYTRCSTPLRADFKSADPSFFYGLREFQVSPLEKMGFTFAGCLKRERQATGATTDISLLVHADGEDSAQIAEIRTFQRTVGLLVFATKFDDGLVLETSNYRGPGVFKAKAKFRSFRFPQIRHIADLYLLHKKIKAEFSATRNPVKFAPAERISTFIADAEEVHRLNLAQGDYKLHSSGDRYVYTLRGAFRHTFLRTWPVGFIRAMVAESTSMKKARQLGYELNPKLGMATPLKITIPRGHSGPDARS